MKGLDYTALTVAIIGAVNCTDRILPASTSSPWSSET